jgi:acetyl-CoA carboxylase biotin carboxyl carrier protein
MVAIEEIEKLIDLMKATGVTELSVENGDFKIFLRRAPMEAEETVVQEPPVQIENTAPAVIDSPIPKDTTVFTPPIISPLVGIFHNGGMPERRTILREGDRVKEGQLIAVIEAMKVPNELHAPIGGVVGRVLVEDGVGVEYGQTLLLIEPEEITAGA